MAERVDAVVIGAGFGGLGAALRLAELGARVVLCEAVKYPGGCAATFSKDGYRFEAGATLSSGLGEHQLFGRWLRRYGLALDVDWLDPALVVRTPELDLVVPGSRAGLEERFAAMPGAPRAGLRAFFAEQERVADFFWEVLDDPDLVPPFGIRGFLRHALRLPRAALLLPGLLGKPLVAVLRRHGLAHFAPLRHYLNAVSQITLQCNADEVEAPLALATADYFFRGTGHIRGGIGRLAEALVDCIAANGGEVRLADAVRRVRRDRPGWLVETRKGVLEADHVFANVLPQQLGELVEPASVLAPRRTALARDVEQSWGAAMLYRVVRDPPETAHEALHLDLTADPSRPLFEGNHVFVSLAARGETDRSPAGTRTATVSTHVPMDRLRSLDDAGQADYIQGIQDRMRETIASRAPEWAEVVHERPGSPRTFRRFTRRSQGFVGGVPRRAGLACYLGLWPRPLGPGLWMVGDSVFPGQSTLACALGGRKAAEAALVGPI
jgi:phytoene dehydrogenase-like protein